MDVESCRSYIDELYSLDHKKCLEAIICLKNSVIGSNRQKGSVIAQGVVPRLLQLLCDLNNFSTIEIRLESAVILGSLAKGTDQHVAALIDLGVVNSLLQVLSMFEVESSNIDNLKLHNLLVEACLRCLRTIFQHSSAPVSLLFQNPDLVPHLLQLSKLSINCQVYVATILTAACKTHEEQNILLNAGAISTLANQLNSHLEEVQLPTLACLANMCYQNQEVASMIAVTETSISLDDQNKRSVTNILGELMGRDKNSLIQLEAARCIAYMYRSQALSASDPRVVYKALPCLIRLCHKDRPAKERVSAAETLAYLTEVDTDLQRLASISNHLIPTLADLLKPSSQIQDAALAQDMRQAAFRAFASLGANDEDIRKRIIETENLMEQVVSGLQDPGGPKVRLAAVRCLHSLSRSVQQLRTTFQDHAVWRPLMQLLHGADKGSDGKHEEDDLLTVASGTLCNLLLEFSPSKEPILESGGVELLCSLTKRSDPALRLNGIWALMNVAFQAEQRVKSQILTSLGTDQIFRLLADSELSVLMKTLGLLRNLLSTKSHIDRIMTDHAAHVMQAVILVLEDPVHSADVKEQALCILANVADGDRARDHIMANEDVLKKLMDYMMHSNVKLQVAAIFCVCNLVWREEPGAAQRQLRLKELGLYRILLQLRHTKDTQLFDKVKTALAQFFDT